MSLASASTVDRPNQAVCMLVPISWTKLLDRFGVFRDGRGHGLRRHNAIGFALWLLFWGTGFAVAQSGTPPKTLQDETPSGQAQVQISDLETFYVPDKDGKLIPVFQFPFEEFERLLQRQKTGEATNTPAASGFRVVQANFLGNADDTFSRVGMRLKLQVILSQSGWQQIPLGLAGWVLQGQVQGTEATAHYLTRAENGGFVLHVNGPVGEVLQFELPLSGRVRRLGHVRQLAIGFPHPTDMNLQLELPATGLEVKGGDLTDLQVREEEGRTVLQVRELTERSVIAWQNVAATAVSFPLQARVDSLLRVQSIGVGAWQINTLLNVTPLNPPVTELIVAIPAGAQNFSTPQSNVRVERISEAEAQQMASQVPTGMQYARLLFDNGLTEAKQLQLTYTVQGESDPERMQSRVELGGPQVLDCLFTPSSLELSKDREVATQWQLGTGISLQATSPEKSEATLFNLERQDFRLTLLNRPQAVQVRVSSQYELIVTQQIVMTARFHCQIQGKFSAPLSMNLGSWQFLSGDSGIQAQDGRLIIDPSAQVVGPDGDLRFDCTLQMEAPDQLDLVLPRLEGEGDASLVQQPGRIVLVLGDASREFVFDAAGSTVLRDAASPFQFRARDANSEIVLRGQLGSRARTVTLRQSTALLPRAAQDGMPNSGLPIRHEIALDVQHQPLPGLSFLLPATAPLQQLQVQFGNEILSTRSTVVRVAEQDFHAIEFPLAPERLRGNLNFVVTHMLDDSAVAADSTDPIIAPVLQVVVEPLSRLVPVTDADALHKFLAHQVAGFQIQEREILTPELAGQRFEVSTPGWGVLAAGGSRDSRSRWIMNGPWPLQVHVGWQSVASVGPEVVVEAVRVRTWWADDQRREQMVATVLSEESQIRVSVPDSLNVQRVLVNGQAVDFKTQDQTGMIEFGLNSGESSDTEPTDGKRHEIEIWYGRNQASGVWTHLTMQLPQLPNQPWCRDFTWEVAGSDWWQILWASNELTQLPNAAYDESGRIADEDSTTTDMALRRYRSQHEPSEHGLILIHRRWFRLGVILLVSGGILLTWGFQWYRSAAYWLSLALLCVWLPWQWPQLGWEAAPWVLIASSSALLVLWIEYATRAGERPVVPELSSDATRTYWNGMPNEQEPRSAPSLSNRSSVVAGDSS